MQTKPFEKSQRQSEIGVALIFFLTLYKLLRGFWAVGAYLIFSSPSIETWIYIGLGSAVLGILILVYSYVYYRKFVFHIDYEKEAFILQKGVFSSEEIEISFDKIQQVNTEQSLLQRLGNVYKLVIDTAGGKEKEVSIQAISKAKANQLSTILMEAKETSVTGEEIGLGNVSTEREKIVWSYKMDIPTLLKIGISSNYFRGLVLIVAFFSTIYQELNRWFQDSERLDSYMSDLPDPSNSISGLLLAGIVVLLGSILITVIEVFVKYFNLKLQRTKNSLQLQMGLQTNKKVSLQPRRVQLLQIKTNPVQKWLNLYEMQISLASSEDSFGKSKIKIPGLGKTIISKVNAFLYTKENTGFKESFRPHIILFYRRLLFSVFPVWIGLCALFFLSDVYFRWWVLLVVLYSIGMGLYQFFLFKSLRLDISENFMIKKHGAWSKVEGRLEIYKMQAITIQQPYFYQKKDLVNIVFHTAGGDISFKAVNKNLLPYINYGIHKIESVKNAWM